MNDTDSRDNVPVLARMDKNVSAEILFRRTFWNGYDLLDIRVFENGRPKQGQGISLRIEKIASFAACLHEVMAQLGVKELSHEP